MDITELGYIKQYIYHYSEDFYLIKNKNVIYAYDYHHNLLGKTKKIPYIIGTRISKEGNVIFSVSNRKYIYIWNIKQQTLNKVNYTKSTDPSFYNIFDDDEFIYIYFSDFNNGNCYHKVACVDKTNLKLKFLEDKIIECIEPQKIFLYKNEIYFLKNEIKKFGYVKHIFYKKEANLIEEKISIQSCCENDMIFKIMDNGRYALVAGVSQDSIGEIIIIDFENNKEIEKLKFFHIFPYVVIANFLAINNEVYVVYQANPMRCKFREKEIWHTYIYSINKKEIICEFPYSLAINYIENTKIIIIESKYPRKASRFFTITDGEIDINDVISLI